MRTLVEWKAFQELVALVQPILMPGFAAEEDVWETDRAAIRRQLDGIMTNTEGAYRLKLLVEATMENVNLENIDAKITKAGRLGVNKLIVVSARGFTSNALKAAQHGGAETWVLRAETDDDWDGLVKKIGINLKLVYPRVENVALKTEGSAGREVQIQLSRANRDSWTVYDGNGIPRANLWDFLEERANTRGSHTFPVVEGDHLYVRGHAGALRSFSFDVDEDETESPMEIDLAEGLIGIFVNAQNPDEWRLVPRPPGFQDSLD